MITIHKDYEEDRKVPEKEGSEEEELTAFVKA